MTPSQEMVTTLFSKETIEKVKMQFKNGNEKVATLLLQVKVNKVMLVAGVKNVPNGKLKAGDWIKAIAPIVGGGGGGRADFAQAGGKDPSKIQEAKTLALEYLKTKLQ